MAREFSRTQRVADQLQRELAQLIQFQVKDPRMGMVTVSAVKISKDLSYADVYVTVLPIGDQDEAECIKASVDVLNNAAGFLRHELATLIKLRILPHLRFHYDESVERGRRIHSLIEKAYQREQQDSDNEE